MLYDDGTALRGGAAANNVGQRHHSSSHHCMEQPTANNSIEERLSRTIKCDLYGLPRVTTTRTRRSHTHRRTTNGIPLSIRIPTSCSNISTTKTISSSQCSTPKTSNLSGSQCMTPKTNNLSSRKRNSATPTKSMLSHNPKYSKQRRAVTVTESIPVEDNSMTGSITPLFDVDLEDGRRDVDKNRHRRHVRFDRVQVREYGRVVNAHGPFRAEHKIKKGVKHYDETTHALFPLGISDEIMNESEHWFEEYEDQRQARGVAPHNGYYYVGQSMARFSMFLSYHADSGLNTITSIDDLIRTESERIGQSYESFKARMKAASHSIREAYDFSEEQRKRRTEVKGKVDEAEVDEEIKKKVKEEAERKKQEDWTRDYKRRKERGERKRQKEKEQGQQREVEEKKIMEPPKYAPPYSYRMSTQLRPLMLNDTGCKIKQFDTEMNDGGRRFEGFVDVELS